MQCFFKKIRIKTCFEILGVLFPILARDLFRAGRKNIKGEIIMKKALMFVAVAALLGTLTGCPHPRVRK